MKIERGNHDANRFFLKKVKLLSKDQKILEIGSGMGGMLKYLQGKGHQVQGIELNEEYIEHAKKELGLEIERTEGEKLNFTDNSFDVVLSFDVFEHIEDSDKHLDEVRRVLKSGGCYILQTPNKLTNVPFEMIKERSFTSYRRYHCSVHSYWGIEKRLNDAGFDVRFVDIPVMNKYFVTKIRKHFGKFALVFMKIINPDKLPKYLRTNFYIVAQHRE